MSNLYSVGASDYDILVSELSGEGEIGDDEVAQALGLAQLGFDELGADQQAAVVGAVKQQLRAAAALHTARPVPPRAAPATAITHAQIQDIVKRAVANANPPGFGILARNVASPEGSFGMKGSMNLLSFTGTVPAGGSLSVPNVALDRKSTIRELRAEQASTPLRVTSFSAAGLPFAALRFPFSLASFGPDVQDRSVRAVTYEASVNFQLVVSNPTGAAIDMLLEAWGTPG